MSPRLIQGLLRGNTALLEAELGCAQGSISIRRPTGHNMVAQNLPLYLFCFMGQVQVRDAFVKDGVYIMNTIPLQRRILSKYVLKRCQK